MKRGGKGSISMDTFIDKFEGKRIVKIVDPEVKAAIGFFKNTDPEYDLWVSLLSNGKDKAVASVNLWAFSTAAENLQFPTFVAIGMTDSDLDGTPDSCEGVVYAIAPSSTPDARIMWYPVQQGRFRPNDMANRDYAMAVEKAFAKTAIEFEDFAAVKAFVDDKAKEYWKKQPDATS